MRKCLNLCVKEIKEIDVVKTINKLGDKVFLNPTGPKAEFEIQGDYYTILELHLGKSEELFEVNEIIELSFQNSEFNSYKCTVENTFTTKTLFKQVLNDKYINEIIISLKSINDEVGLILLKDEIIVKLTKKMMKFNYIDLEPHYKIGAHVDLFLEHLVSLCKEFNDEDRKRIVPLLFLPLDRNIFGYSYIFNSDDIKKLKVKRKYEYTRLNTLEHYLQIQNFIKEKAKKLNIKHRIYFQLISNNRYFESQSNLYNLTKRVDLNWYTGCRCYYII